MRFNEYRYYDISSDQEVVRLSAFNRRGHEYWINLPDDSGTAWRARRARACDAIEAAILLGKPPGPVILENDDDG